MKIENYNFITATSITKRNGKERTFIDITVENDHHFLIKNVKTNEWILTHNCDGHHISSLLINFFYRWFPHVITERRLNILITPLVSAEIAGKLQYYYSNDEFDQIRDKAKNVRYLKGLGSLNQKDWEKIMKEKKTYLVRECTRTERSLKIAFGENAGLRKKWLAS